MDKLTERLDKLRSLVQDRDFLEGKGLSNEVNIRIFCYEPEEEMAVRHFVEQLMADEDAGRHIWVSDLYEVFLEICQDMGILDSIPDMESEEGSAYTLEQIHCAIGEDAFIEKLQEKAASRSYDVLMMTGIGDVFPFMRVHKMLEAMQPYFSDKPILVLYPGKFDGSALKLFNRLSPNAYYRAFSVI